MNLDKELSCLRMVTHSKYELRDDNRMKSRAALKILIKSFGASKKDEIAAAEILNSPELMNWLKELPPAIKRSLKSNLVEKIVKTGMPNDLVRFNNWLELESIWAGVAGSATSVVLEQKYSASRSFGEDLICSWLDVLLNKRKNGAESWIKYLDSVGIKMRKDGYCSGFIAAEKNLLVRLIKKDASQRVIEIFLAQNLALNQDVITECVWSCGVHNRIDLLDVLKTHGLLEIFNSDKIEMPKNGLNQAMYLISQKFPMLAGANYRGPMEEKYAIADWAIKNISVSDEQRNVLMSGRKELEEHNQYFVDELERKELIKSIGCNDKKSVKVAL